MPDHDQLGATRRGQQGRCGVPRDQADPHLDLRELLNHAREGLRDQLLLLREVHGVRTTAGSRGVDRVVVAVQDGQWAAVQRGHAVRELHGRQRVLGPVHAEQHAVSGTRARPQDDHGTGRVLGHGDADGSEQEGGHGAAAARADDDHGRLPAHLEQGAAGVGLAGDGEHLETAVAPPDPHGRPGYHGRVLGPDLLCEARGVDAPAPVVPAAGKGDRVHAVQQREGAVLERRLVRSPVQGHVRPDGTVDADHDAAWGCLEAHAASLSVPTAAVHGPKPRR